MTNSSLQWRIVFEKKAEKILLKLQKQTQYAIALYLESLLQSKDPRSKGAMLKNTIRDICGVIEWAIIVFYAK